MIRNVVERILNVDTFGVIAVVFFFAFFVGMLLWAFRLKKGYLNTMSELPLEDGTQPSVDSSTQETFKHE